MTKKKDKADLLKEGAKPIYTDELACDICELIATSSKGIHAICKGDDRFPSVMTVFRWLNPLSPSYQPKFCELYACAKEMQAEYMKDEILAISDDSSQDDEIRHTVTGEEYIVENREFVNRSKLRVDTRKFLMAKLYPKVYGEKIQQEHSGAISGIAPAINVYNSGPPLASNESEVKE